MPLHFPRHVPANDKKIPLSQRHWLTPEYRAKLVEMFSIRTAAKNKKQVTLNLNEVEGMVAKKVTQNPSSNRTHIEAGVNAIKEVSGELSVPSVGTLRAYAGIDTPIRT